MKKQLIYLVLVILIVLVTATPALARPEAGSFTVGGHIAALSDDSITVQTVTEKLIEVKLDSDTIFLLWTEDGREPSSFGDVEVEDSINIKGTVDGGGYIASQVTVDVQLSCIP